MRGLFCGVQVLQAGPQAPAVVVKPLPVEAESLAAAFSRHNKAVRTVLLGIRVRLCDERRLNRLEPELAKDTSILVCKRRSDSQMVKNPQKRSTAK